METPAPTRKRGCLFYGCICGVVLLLVILAAGWTGYRYMKGVLTRFTDSGPMPLPAVEMPAAQVEVLKQRYVEFWDAVRNQRAVPPLTLSSDEINALIADPSTSGGWKGRVYVTIDGNQLKGKLSVPMEALGLPIFHGRYLNGAGTFSLSLRDGEIQWSALELSVKDKPLPEIYMRKIRSENLARNINTDPRTRNTIDQLESIEVKDGKLVITPKLKR